MYRRHKSIERFPFVTFRWLGWSLCIILLIIIALSIADLSYTVGKYTSNCNPTAYSPRTPCDHKSFIFTYIASGIWASFFALVPGYIATQFSIHQISRRRHLQRLKDGLAFTASMVVVMFAPAVIVLYSIEAYQGKDTFYYYTDQKLNTVDATKMALPIVIVLLAFFEWCTALILLYMCWIFSPISRYDFPSPDNSVIRGNGGRPYVTASLPSPRWHSNRDRYPADRKMHWPYDNMYI